MVRIQIKNNSKQEFYLSPEIILKYLITDDDKIDTLVMCKSSEIDLVTTDYSLYEAIGSIKPYDQTKLNKLVKLLEVVEVVSYKNRMNKEKPILKEDRVEELRKLALKENKKWGGTKKLKWQKEN